MTNYKVDYKKLNDLYDSVNTFSDTWMRELQRAKEASNAIVYSPSISGEGADNIKQYFNTVYGTLISEITSVIEKNEKLLKAYKEDYKNRVDKDEHTAISTKELDDIRKKSESQRKAADSIHSEIGSALKKISSIYSVRNPSASDIVEIHKSIESLTKSLCDAIDTLEKAHKGSDFSHVEAEINSIRQLINAHLSHGRSYKTGFNTTAFFASSEYLVLKQASVELNEYYSSRTIDIDYADKSHEKRLEILAEERRQRENVAKALKIGALVLGIVAGIALSAVCPAASPLIIGAISGAISGALTEGTNAAMNAWVEDGEIDKNEWKNVGKETLTGGVKGAVTGIISSGVTEGAKYITDNSIIGTTVLSSENGIVRTVAGGVVGSATDVVSGVIKRGTGEVIDEAIDGDFSWGKIKDKAFDEKKMAKDAVYGFVSNGLSENKRYNKEKEYQEMQDEGQDLLGNQYLSRAEMKRNGWNPYLEDKYARLDKANSEKSIVDTFTEDRENVAKDTFTIIKSVVSDFEIVLQP